MVTIEDIKKGMGLMIEQMPSEKKEYKIYVSRHWYRQGLKAARKGNSAFSFHDKKLFFGKIEVITT